MIKNALAFGDHWQDENAFYEIIAESRRYGCAMPSGYPATFHAIYKSAAIPWTINAIFARSFAGGWQAALQPGQYEGLNFRYDIVSAYLWALDEWLPNPESYAYCDRLQDDALFNIEHVPRSDLPYPFDSQTRVNATLLEIEIYELEVKKIYGGVSWSRKISTGDIRRSLYSLSFWKQAARSYWGRWAMVGQVECRTQANAWKLPSRFCNLPWAHLILSRVRMRLYHEVLHGDVYHVYVDSIICRNQRPYGKNVGEWKRDHIYTDGVAILGPGHYGPLYGKVEKWAGLRRNDPRRSFASLNPYNGEGRI
jgi:hypothetical protein